ncbi:MAG: biopolymer transporter ExbD [Treponema sp.]|nr:biopolymer transporter ExbD [Treponema sp.]MCL2236720.1 biopolymer transporter ExbD [Treponema sp.]
MKLRRKSQFVNVPLFSTSDIAFLLLIFIMLVSLINYRVEVKIDYPEAQSALRATAEKNLEVWVQKDGNIFLDGLASDRLEFERKIQNLYITSPDTRVHIIADKNTPYMHINSILEIMQLLQYRVVSFVVKTNE